VQSSRVGECIGTDELKEIYKSLREDALTSSKLGHIVSCASCLDEVNQILSLSSLHERYKPGSTRDNRKPPDGSGGDSSDGPTDGPIDFSTKLRERLEEVVHHKPKELRVSVNGTVVGSISVGAESSELVLKLPPEEEIDFVEVHGDERILLLFFDLAGHFERLDDEWAQIDLSDGRIITVYLSENSDDKKLRVSYEVPALDETSDEELLTYAQVKARPTYGLARLGEAISNLNITGWWLKPTLAMLLLLSLMTAASFLLKSRPTVSEIMGESRLNEDLRAVTDQQITYQVVEIEEVNNVGDVIVVSKLETWHDRLSSRDRYEEEAGQKDVVQRVTLVSTCSTQSVGIGFCSTQRAKTLAPNLRSHLSTAKFSASSVFLGQILITVVDRKCLKLAANPTLSLN